LKRSHKNGIGVPLRRTSLRRKAEVKNKRVPAEVLEAVYRRDNGICIVCGRVVWNDFPHHVLPKAKWPELKDDRWNLATIHLSCHANHENASRRIRRDELPAETLEVLAKLDARIQAYVERTYPYS